MASYSKKQLSAQEWSMYGLMNNYALDNKEKKMTVEEWFKQKLKEFRERSGS